MTPALPFCPQRTDPRTEAGRPRDRRYPSAIATFAKASPSFPPTSALAAAKRPGRGRGRATSRGRTRSRSDLGDDVQTTNGATHPITAPIFSFASASTSPQDAARRDSLLRRLNEITQQKYRLERRQHRNAVKDVDAGNGHAPTLTSSAAPVEDANDFKLSAARKHGPTPDAESNGTKKKRTSFPKRRRGDHGADVKSVADSTSAVQGSSQRNGKHHSSKSKGHTHDSKPAPPPPIDLDAISKPSRSSEFDSASIGGGGGGGGGKGARATAYQVSSAASPRGSGRIRTPSVLLSSQPGEKTLVTIDSLVGKNKQAGYCLKIVKEMLRLKDGYGFSKPIEQLWAIDQLPGYFDMISHPMDLGTVKRRLENGHYMVSPGKEEVEAVEFDVEGFCTDMRLIFTNAHTYNRAGDIFYDAATRLSDKFEQRIAALPSPEQLAAQALKKGKKRKKTSGEGSKKKTDPSSKKRKVSSSNNKEKNGPSKRPPGKKKPASQDAKGQGSASGTARKKQASKPEVVEVKNVNEMSVADIEMRLRSLKRQRAVHDGSPAASPAAGNSFMAQAQALYDVDMTFDEKVRLSENVSALPADKLQKIVALATKNKGSQMEVNNNEEIELDIESMDNRTLREMEAYVNHTLSKQKKKKGAKGTGVDDDIPGMTPAQVNSEIEKLTATLRKRTKGKGKELVQKPEKGSGDKKEKSFYDSESSSDSDDSGSDSDSSGGSSSDSDSSDDESDAAAMRKRRERNLAHQQAMQAAGTPLASPAYQNNR